MDDDRTPNALTIITDFLATQPTPQDIIAFRFPDALVDRAHDLLDRNNACTLTPSEIQELHGINHANTLMALASAKARLKLLQIAQ